MFNPIIQGLKNIYSAQGLLMKYVTKHKLKDAEQIKLQLNTAISLVY